MFNRVATRAIPVLSRQQVLFIPNRSRLFTQPQRAFASESKVVALIDAVRTQNTSAIAKIAKADPALIGEQTSGDNSALHEAAKKGDVQMIRVLAKEFATKINVNYRCHCFDTRTPIQYAASGGHVDAVNELMKMGANPNLEDGRGKTALDYALEHGHEKVALVLYKAGGRANKLKDQAQGLGAKLSANQFAQDYLAKQPTEVRANKAKALDKDAFEKFAADLRNSKQNKRS